jgi:hypothetical protein
MKMPTELSHADEIGASASAKPPQRGKAPGSAGGAALMASLVTADVAGEGPATISNSEWLVGTALCFAFIYVGRLLPYATVAERQRKTAAFFSGVTVGSKDFDMLVALMKAMLEGGLEDNAEW